MIEPSAPTQQASAPVLSVLGDSIKGDVFGHLRPLMFARDKGLDVYFKAGQLWTCVDYQQLLSMPAFRAGVLAALASEQVARQADGV